MPPPNACVVALGAAGRAALKIPGLSAALAGATAALAAEDYPLAISFLLGAYLEVQGIDEQVALLVNQALTCIESFAAGFTGGGNQVACTYKHSSTVQGPGLCCQAVQNGGLIVPPAGTILPQYTPGSAATLPAGRHVQVVDSGGHCATCMIVGSTSKKHPGKPVLKFIRGGPGCPTSSTGCCALTA
jgi:hypothetical protein